jgi:NADH-quinone oxidoreductase subunit M
MIHRRAPVKLLILLALLSGTTAFLPHHLIALGLLLVPLIGVIIGGLLPRRVRGKTWGLAVSASTLVCAVTMAFNYDWAKGGMQFVLNGPELPGFGIAFRIGVDQISLMLILMTAALHPLAVTASLRSVQRHSREHYAWMNFLLITMHGTFLATDLVLFYAFFEVSLVPLFFIVGIWGGKDRRKAATKLFLYTFAGSIFMLAGVAYVGMRAGTFYLPDVIAFAQGTLAVHGHEAFTNTERFWVLLSFLGAFAVKTPLVPFHTWLPLAHTEAPTAGSVDLAALVLKLGTYGLLRIALPIGLITAAGGILFPQVLTFLGILCLIGIIYAALVAWVQTDIKKLVAYSSVSHMGFCVLGMLALNPEGMAGSVLYMVNHGIVSGALFLIVGMIYNRYHTRDIRELSGLTKAMPKLAFFLVLFAMASVGLPGLNNFVSEFLAILGTFTSTHLGMTFGIIASTGIVLGAVYMLHFVAKVLFGPLEYPVIHEETGTHHTIHPAYVTGGDITTREVLVLAPLALAVVVLGIFPGPMLRAIERPLAAIRNAQVVTMPVTQTPLTTQTASVSAPVVAPLAVESH